MANWRKRSSTLSPEAVPQSIRTVYDADREAIEGRLHELVGALANEPQGMREAILWYTNDLAGR